MSDEIKTPDPAPAPLSTVDSQTTPDKGPPDAILYPESFKSGETIWDRLKNIQDRFAPTLGKLTHPAIRIVGKGYMAIRGESREGRHYSAFDWVDQPDGTSFGYLKKSE